MSKEEENIWLVVESVLDLANQAADSVGEDAVNSALLYVAARYAAFVVAANTDDLEDDKSAAERHITDHFRELLEENLQFYQDNPLEKPKAESDAE